MLPEPFTVASCGALGEDPFTTFVDGYVLGDADLIDEIEPGPFPAVASSTLVASAASSTSFQVLHASSTLEPGAESSTTTTVASATSASSPPAAANTTLSPSASSKTVIH